MKRGIRIVAPFRPFQPESELHKATAGFDWVQAIRMLFHTAQVACHCPVHVITDVDTDLPVPMLQYRTEQRRLMLWYLEVAACYLSSADCDRDTVMLDSDQLIYGDLARFFTPRVDLGILVRATPKHTEPDNGMPVLNGVQFWSVRARKRLAAFFRRALAIALALPEPRIVWGADTDALRLLVEPIELGIHQRAGLLVEMIDADRVLETCSTAHTDALAAGRTPWPTRSVLDFRWTRKTHMRAMYEATMLAGAVR